MTESELEHLLLDLESDRVERKESLAEPEKVRQAICAFANDLPDHRAPGVLFVGVKDKGGHSGLAITDELLRAIADMRSDGNILPLPVMSVQKRRLSVGEVAVVEVLPAEAPPVRYKGRIWVRVGPRRAVASAQEERILSERRRSRDPFFDLRAVYAATLQDMDLDRFRRTYLPAAVAPDILAQNERSVEQQLASVRFVNDPVNAVPTALGIIVVGNDTRRFFPGNYVQFLRVARELTDPPTDSAVIDGPLPDLVAKLDQKLTAHIRTSSEFATVSVEIKRPDYPLVALQQITRNAIMHRVYEGTNTPVRVTWYDDRIEILSPGGPYGNVRVDNFGEPGLSDYRNPHLAEAMLHLGFVQRFGVGIHLARQALAQNGNPPLEFKVNESYVLAIIRSKP